jgi:16S rRNA (guanine527-N7)-methyltransferase
LAYARAVGRAPALAADLGPGGGLPSLVLAQQWPATNWLLIETDSTRVSFLQAGVQRLDVADRVTVVHERAETVGRDSAWRHRFDLVVARSFGPPAVTAECAAPLLRLGGLAVVSDPPTGSGDRWGGAGEMTGLTPVRVHEEATAHLTILEQVTLCPDRLPRRPGVPARKPLF